MDFVLWLQGKNGGQEQKREREEYKDWEVVIVYDDILDLWGELGPISVHPHGGNQLGLMQCSLIIFWMVVIGGLAFDIITCWPQVLRERGHQKFSIVVVAHYVRQLKFSFCTGIY